MFWDVLNKIWPFLENVCCLYVYKILWTLYLKHFCAEIDETLFSVAPLHNLVLIRFWCISLKKFCCSKFLISLTQCYRTKLHATVPNMIYFKLIIFKFKILIIAIVRYYNFCMYCSNNPPVGEGVVTSPSLEEEISYSWYF